MGALSVTSGGGGPQRVGVCDDSSCCWKRSRAALTCLRPPPAPTSHETSIGGPTTGAGNRSNVAANHGPRRPRRLWFSTGTYRDRRGILCRCVGARGVGGAGRGRCARAVCAAGHGRAGPAPRARPAHALRRLQTFLKERPTCAQARRRRLLARALPATRAAPRLGSCSIGRDAETSHCTPCNCARRALAVPRMGVSWQNRWYLSVCCRVLRRS